MIFLGDLSYFIILILTHIHLTHGRIQVINILLVATWLSIIWDEFVRGVRLFHLFLDWKVYSCFKFSVGLLLYSLSVLKLFDKLHFKHFHLHHFSFLLSNNFFFLGNFSSNLFARNPMLLPSEVVDFGPHDFILLPLNLVFHQFFL